MLNKNKYEVFKNDSPGDEQSARLGDIYGASTEPEQPARKFFTGDRPSMFMQFQSSRSEGHVNPAFEKDDGGDTEEDLSSDPECNSNASIDDQSSQRTSDGFTGEPLSNGNIANGGKNFKVGFSSLEEQTMSPPRSPSKKPKVPKSWDRFQVSSKDNYSSSDLQFWDKVFVVTKIIFSILLFILTLGTAVVTKICFVLITANIFPSEGANNTKYTLKTLNNTLEQTQNPKSKTNVQWLWALIMMAGAPHVFTCVKSLWRLLFQHTGRTKPSWTTTLSILLIETIHSIGVNLMIFIVIPHFDPISGLLMTLCVGVIPGILKIFYPTVGPTEKMTAIERPSFFRKACVRMTSTFAALGQLLAIGVWVYYIYHTISHNNTELVLMISMIIAPIFTSIYWWENFMYEGDKQSTGLKFLARQMRKCRTKLTLYTSAWNLILTILVPTAIYGFACHDLDASCVRTLYFMNKTAKLNSGIGNVVLTSAIQDQFDKCNDYLPLIVAAIGILSSGVCFKLGKIGCKIMTQIVDYSLPLVLATPATLALILGMYTGFLTVSDKSCALPFPTFANDSRDFFGSLGNDYWLPVIAGVAAFISFLMVTNHVWTPGKERLQTTDRLFVQPLYCGIFTDQSLLLNRRRIEKAKISNEVKSRIGNIPLSFDELVDDLDEKSQFATTDTPMIYLCGTMWHESENEMTQLLKSIFRVDLDQITRRHAQFMMNRRDPDYYEFEAHIFFDDAFEGHRDDEYDFTVNEYVKLLLKTMAVSACSVHGPNWKISKPVKVATPYGGRLVWTLPGKNKLVAHLKDKSLIRHRKRWSQVMYMYYFLGYELCNKGLKARALQKRAENTFLLALDGDVDFQPQAMLLLIDRMRKNADVGAACGRIHPIGNGAMVWYQKFEYAVSHWLQKAAEDKFGCVLCSPGCFSLFRGSALMDENVMKKYTTPPTEPRHYVQYDQGEDRWLCTLLLQQGHRVEYCAASDALTYAPEGFYEFFNQRRRWTPSTMANIMDLLTDWKNVTKRNGEITFAYIMYQGLLMVSSILAPGTIFLMILGAINLAYSTIELWYALLINAVPVAVFIILCFRAKSSTQLTYAAILSTLYSLVMMIVIVGLLRQAAQFGWCSVTTFFLSFVAGVFVLSALIHPQEFWCIIHGFLYFLAIPAMSMILMLYALGNLHVVSWGTRENKTAATQEAEKKENKITGFLGMFGGCCPWGLSAVQREDAGLREVLDRLNGVEQAVRAISTVGSSRMSPLNDSLIVENSSPIMMGEESGQAHFNQTPELFSATGRRDNPLFDDQQKPRDPMRNPYWIEEDEDMHKLARDEISTHETQFWSELIEEYLKPIEADKNKEKEILAQLIELRNKVCLIFILINSLFIIIVFSLQQVVAEESRNLANELDLSHLLEEGYRFSRGSLSFNLPCADVDKDGKAPNGQQVEPISVAFTLVFGVLLFVQFICMLMHRMATLLHICASTEIFKKKRTIDLKTNAEDGIEAPARTEMSYQEVFEFVKDMQKDQDEETGSLTSESSFGGKSDVDDDDEEAATKRKLNRERWKQLAKNRRHKHNKTLGANFRNNFLHLQQNMDRIQEKSGENDDSDNEAEAIKKTLKFNRMRPQSLHVIKLMANDPKMKASITNKKVRIQALKTEKTRMNWARGRAAAIGQNKRLSFGQVVKAAGLKHQVDAIDHAIKETEAAPSPLLPKKPAPEGTTIQVEVEQGQGHHTTISDMNTKFDSIRKRGTSTRRPSSSSESEEADIPLQLIVPKVEGDEWPGEESYAQSHDTIDVLF